MLPLDAGGMQGASKASQSWRFQYNWLPRRHLHTTYTTPTPTVMATNLVIDLTYIEGRFTKDNRQSTLMWTNMGEGISLNFWRKCSAGRSSPSRLYLSVWRNLRRRYLLYYVVVRMMTWEGFGSKWSWPYRTIVPEFVWKNWEKPGKYRWNRQCPSRDSETIPSEYVSRVLPLRQPRQLMSHLHHTSQTSYFNFSVDCRGNSLALLKVAEMRLSSRQEHRLRRNHGRS